MRYTDRVLAAGAAPWVGSVGDADDNALVESVIGRYKTDVIRRRGPWRGFEDVEDATLECVAWFNTQRLLELLAYFPRRSSRSSTTASRPLNPSAWQSTHRVS